MRYHVAASNREVAPVLDEASTLFAQKQQLETKQQLLDAFQKHFRVSEADLISLTSSGEPIDDRFFTVLAKVKKIHKDCEVLLGTENQRLGLEIMEQSTKNLNIAFQKLYRWIQREFKTLNLENPQISLSIRRALRVLAERPSLFQSCLDYFAEAREHIMSDSFYAALTGHVQGSAEEPSTKPIELYAHDPLRYVGDMLAWTHSATVSEREALEVLFISEGDEIAKSMQAGLESEPWSREDETVERFDGQRALHGLVNRDLAGVARLLRQRVEQVVQSHEDSTLAFQIGNLINFYHHTFTKLLGDDSSLLVTLTELEKSALRQFRVTLGDHVLNLQRDLPHPSPDLSIPHFLGEALDKLKVLMKSFDTSLARSTVDEDDFQPVLEAALDPFLKCCETLSRELEEPSNIIFVLNTLLASKEVLSPFGFCSERVEGIVEALDKHTTRLVEFQHAFFLQTSGLYPLTDALENIAESNEDAKAILALPSFQQKAVASVSETLDYFLPSALMDATENLKRLQNPKIAKEITEKGAELFCEDFELVESKIIQVDELRAGKTEDGGSLRAVFPRTSGEIRVLLS
jgi:conserved oligomeric Golgi complex subunit 6